MVAYSFSISFTYDNGVPVGLANVNVFDTDTNYNVNNPLNPFDDTSSDVDNTVATPTTDENGWISGTIDLPVGNAARLSFEISKDGVSSRFNHPLPAPLPGMPAIDHMINTHWPNGPKRCLKHEDPNPFARLGRLAIRLLLFQVQRLTALPDSVTLFPRPIILMRPLPVQLPDPLDTFSVLPAIPSPRYILARNNHASTFLNAAAEAGSDPRPEFQTREDYRKIFDPLPDSIPKPKSVDMIGDNVMPDDVFAYQRIGGVNPRTIARVGSADAPIVPPGFELSEEFVRRRTGLRLDQLQSAHRLYVCDYSRLSPFLAPFQQGDRRAQTAVALFFYGRPPVQLPANWQLRADNFLRGELVSGRITLGNLGGVTGKVKEPEIPGPSPGMVLQPLAIMVIEADGSRHTVTPDQGEAWDKAKLIAHVADLNVHELEMHLWNCHFAMEPVVLSMVRQLDEKHPLRELLIRHSYGLLWINNHGVVTLVKKTTGSGDYGHGHQQLMLNFEGMCSSLALAQARWSWRTTQLRTDLARRGMNFEEAILGYPYRDDGLRVLDVIRTFTGEYVDVYYDNDNEVSRDEELSSWLKEMVAMGITGLPTVNSKATLADFLSDYIFQMSALHAAVNAPQWDYNAYSLDMPGYLRKVEPRGDLVPMYPHKKDAIMMGSLMGRLATFHWENGLGYYRDTGNLIDDTMLLPFPDDRAEAAAGRFRTAADLLSDQISIDNQHRHPAYEYLMPRGMDNSTHT